MRLLTSALVGVLAAFLASLVWILLAFVLPLALDYVAWRRSDQGVGGSSASISSGSLLVAALVGFASGFLWHGRRASKRG